MTERQEAVHAVNGRPVSGASALAAVVEGGSLVKAAGLIGITASGVSRAISRLEGRLGVRLLDRTTRSMTLTDEGQRFYDEVRPHFDAIEDAAAVASGAVSAVRGRLKVDIDPFFLPLALAGRLGDFCAEIAGALDRTRQPESLDSAAHSKPAPSRRVRSGAHPHSA